jgi:hypothetical protein
MQSLTLQPVSFNLTAFHVTGMQSCNSRLSMSPAAVAQ